MPICIIGEYSLDQTCRNYYERHLTGVTVFDSIYIYFDDDARQNDAKNSKWIGEIDLAFLIRLRSFLAVLSRPICSWNDFKYVTYINVFTFETFNAYSISYQKKMDANFVFPFLERKKLVRKLVVRKSFFLKKSKFLDSWTCNHVTIRNFF